MLVLAFVVSIVAAGVLVAAWDLSHWRGLTRRRVLVTVEDGRTIGGVLWRRRGPLLVLRDAAVFERGNPYLVDGELVIERARIRWVQVTS